MRTQTNAKNRHLFAIAAFLVTFTLSFVASSANAQAEHFYDTPDVVFAHITDADSLAEVLASPESLNLMSRPSVRASLDSIYAEATDPRSPLGRSILANTASIRQKNFLASLGAQSPTSNAPTVYYPFGGADVPTAYTMFPQARDIFIQTGDGFGSADALVKLRSMNNIFRGGDTWGRFDSYIALAEMQDDAGVTGTGFSMVARIIGHLNGHVEGIYPFQLNGDGKIVFTRPWSGEVSANAMILFRAKSGELKRVWQIQWSMQDALGPFEKFLSHLSFGNMIIKAAPSMLFDREDRSRALVISVDQAKRNRAFVIADQRISTQGDRMTSSVPQPIFRRGAWIQTLKIPAQSRYGYSRWRGSVFLSSADALIDSSTPLKLVENREASQIVAPSGRRGWLDCVIALWRKKRG